MTTISEFIDGAALEEIIVFNCPKYREKFSKIVEKSGVGDTNLEEFLQDRWWKPSPTAKKIMGYPFPKFRTWNWAGFFFNSYWAIYRKQKFGWVVLIVSLLVISYEPYASESSQLVYLPYIMVIWFGGVGNSMILRSALKTYANKTSPTDRNPRSIIGVIVAILLTIVYLGIYGFLMNKGIIPAIPTE